MRRRYERNADDANRQELVDQLEQVVRFGAINYLVKSGRYMAETAKGLGYVTLSRRGIETSSLWLRMPDEQTAIHSLDRPNGSWTVSKYLYKSSYEEESRGGLDLLEASSGVLSPHTSEDIEVFAKFFSGAMKKIRKMPKNPDKLQ